MTSFQVFFGSYSPLIERSFRRLCTLRAARLPDADLNPRAVSTSKPCFAKMASFAAVIAHWDAFSAATPYLRADLIPLSGNRLMPGNAIL
jgi:hypothetical protein